MAYLNALNLLDDVFSNTSLVFYIAHVDENFRLSFISQSVSRLLNVNYQDCFGNFWLEHTHPDDYVVLQAGFDQLMLRGSMSVDFRFRDGDDNYFWLRNEGSLKQQDEDAYISGVLRDISVEKKCLAEFAQHLNEQHGHEYFYRSILDSLPQRLFWKDRQSVFRGCNLSGARALKLSATEEIVGKTDYDFFSDRAEANYLYWDDERVMQSGVSTLQSGKLAKEPNTWLDVMKVPLRDEQNEIYGVLISYQDVSALKKSEIALHKFERAVEQSSNSIFITDLAGNIEYVNPVFLDTYKYEKQEVLGKNPRLLKSGLVHDSVFKALWETLLAGKSWQGEMANRAKTGEICWQAFCASPIFDENNNIVNFVCIENNITERKKMEQALAFSEAYLREITRTMGEGIYVIDDQDIVTFVNPAAEKIFGWHERELLGQSVKLIFHCQTQVNTNAQCKILNEVKQVRKIVRREGVVFVHKNGYEFPVSVIVAPILRSHRYAGAVFAFHDITEQSMIQKLLGETLQQLRTVLDNAQIGVAYVRDKKFYWINRHMEQMFGYHSGGLHGKPMSMIYADREDALQSSFSLEQIEALLATGGVYEAEIVMTRRNGERFWCHQRGVAIDVQNLSQGSIWIMLDIDRLKQTEQNLKSLNETLAQRVYVETQRTLEKERMLIQQGRSAAMGEMIGNIAHQWRQPLSTLGLIVQNIQSDYQDNSLDNDVLDGYVEQAKHAIQRMSCTIDDFRNFFRRDWGTECFSIYQSITETIRLLDAMLKNHGIMVQLTGNEDLSIHGNPNEFSQVILNFLANAKEVIVERKIQQGVIEIELFNQSQQCIVKIRDNAGGIPVHLLERIFDPYFTTKPTGTGIGLHMNKTIIEKHMRGKITCQNVKHGAEFTISVPLASNHNA